MSHPLPDQPAQWRYGLFIVRANNSTEMWWVSDYRVVCGVLVMHDAVRAFRGGLRQDQGEPERVLIPLGATVTEIRVLPMRETAR